MLHIYFLFSPKLVTFLNLYLFHITDSETHFSL